MIKRELMKDPALARGELGQVPAKVSQNQCAEKKASQEKGEEELHSIPSPSD